ncbi:hypothetical protein D8I35_07165 [Corticibacter populi]|uniref:Uncharacterized protein n=1 Tax=Corticibacter populi TaxID=1550736 RepID=A0A3M6QTG2_9BURK|nr:TadG family pilus assembly protein [Corticibacter populi]RMX06320.1 hypothetical protein D8I35_07165 [Corticibacter populi]RZS32142.1 putative membrane protein [Corticibacter populi]
MTHRYAPSAPVLRQLRQGPATGQGGSILVQFALILAVLVAILGTVDIGYMYYAKRDLQRIADLAAIEAVQNIDYQSGAGAGSCIAAGNTSIQNNWPIAVTRDDGQTSVTCGNWNPGEHAEPRHFAAVTAAGPLNAAHVVVQGTSPTILPGPWSRTIVAEAVARRNEPVAAFQVGAQLLRFDEDALLGSLLGAVGLSIDDLRLLDSDGLASARISPSGLLDLLGVDLGIGGVGVLTPDGVADIDNITLLNILDASLAAATDDALNLDLQALRTRILQLGLGNVVIPLGSSENTSGLFAFLGIGRDDPLDAALDVQIGLGDLIKTAIGIAANGHAIEVPDLNVAGLVQAKASIVEPPTIAIGPVGTKGYSAQVRLFLDVDTQNLLGGALNWLLEGILGIRVHLPIAVDVVSAQGELTDIQCRRIPQTIDIAVDSAVANVCVGNMSEDNIMSNTNRCDSFLGEEQLVKLLHAPILSGKLHIPALSYVDDTTGLDMQVGDERATRPNALALGDTVDNVVTGLLNLLSGLFRDPAPTMVGDWEGAPYNAQNTIALMAEFYLEASKDSAGFYNVANVSNLVLSGSGSPDQDGYMPPLLTSNFEFNNAVATTCLLVACPSAWWNRGSFTQALQSYTSVPGSLLDLLGISTFDNGYRSCAGLLSSLLNWNGCVKHNLTRLLQSHQGSLHPLSPNSATIDSLMDPNSSAVACNGALCLLLKPVLQTLKPVLNGVGGLLTTILDDALGLELGRTDIKALAIECDTAQLVY